eukprot:Tbor_TRINITY_DN3728_c0_g1::TRINITY_DN3728_c0_g1_i1::g.2424::m.2424/K18168/SDHAF2, SDH5; succinate dehydrogenase assembly factor 2
MFRHAISSTVALLSRKDIPKELREMANKPIEFDKLKPESMASFKDTRVLSTKEEPLPDLRRRLCYQSRYRGMVEMDLILGAFALNSLENFSREQLMQYDKLLRQLDNDLFKWLVLGNEAPVEIREGNAVWKALNLFIEENQDKLVKNSH